jgi:hypothetical protein
MSISAGPWSRTLARCVTISVDDAKRMAGDADLALRQAAIAEGGTDTVAARRYFAGLAKAGRYQRDVY